MTSINDAEWPLPPASEQDEATSERLMSTGGRFSPGKQWDIDCLVRVVAPALDQHGLLDGPAPWIEARSSRSEMAGGLTVEFAPHPDESDPHHQKMRFFRFRSQRMTRSQEALRDLHEAAARRAFLIRRRSAIDAGLLSEEQALVCDAVLPRLLEEAGIAVQDVAIRAAADDEIVFGADPTGEREAPVHLVRRGSDIQVMRVTLEGTLTYRGGHGDPTIVMRGLALSEADLAAAPGRPAIEVTGCAALDVPGLSVTKAWRRGDATVLWLTRPQATLVEIPR